MYFEYMESKLSIICYGYTVYKWIRVYLGYIANLSRLSHVSDMWITPDTYR